MKTTEIKKLILEEGLNTVFQELYFDQTLIKKQQERYVKALEAFEELYGEKDIEIYSAPGRTEIGGNHTDHQNGRVLAGSVNLDAIAVVSKTDNNVVHIESEGYSAVQ